MNRGTRWISLAGWLAAASCFGAFVAVAQDSKRSSDQELELVRKLNDAREQYQLSLERLISFYEQLGHQENQRLAEKELIDFHLMLKHPYALELDLPSPELRPDTSIPAANELFSQALQWLGKRTLIDRGENAKRAELLLRKLIREYPRSDKLEESCYYLGEIYSSKHFQQYERAVAFYERVFHYEDHTGLDARLRAARIYEKYLKEKQKAVRLYEEVLRREVDGVQIREARKRLDELTGTRTTNFR